MAGFSMGVKMIVVLAISVSALTAFANEPASSHPRAHASMSQLGRTISEKAALAVAQFQERAGGKLDYSVESLQVVEEMLAEASAHRSNISEKNQNALVELFGSYILMVAYEQYGGTFYWHEQWEQPILVVGEPKFHVGLLVFDKVRGRLGGDESDSIPFFYEGFSERARAAIPGTRSTHL